MFYSDNFHFCEIKTVFCPDDVASFISEINIKVLPLINICCCCSRPPGGDRTMKLMIKVNKGAETRDSAHSFNSGNTTADSFFKNGSQQREKSLATFLPPTENR